jgi:hypothetical protein
MDRVAAFIDAGYLFAQGSALITGRKRIRGDLTLDTAQVVGAIGAFAERVAQVPLLRIYWYDGTSTGPTGQHITLAHMPGVKIRLGFVNRAGEQKGVDSLIVTDMINLARNRAMTDAVLLSGDEDTRVGVQQAQEFGVRVHLLGINPARGSQSIFLLQEADTTHEWFDADVRVFMAHTPRNVGDPAPSAPATLSAAGVSVDASLGSVALASAAAIARNSLEALVAGYRSGAKIPRELDARMLARARNAIGRDLDAKQKKELRATFIAECERRLFGT